MGKGSKQRPKSVSESEFGSAYDRIFGASKKRATDDLQLSLQLPNENVSEGHLIAESDCATFGSSDSGHGCNSHQPESHIMYEAIVWIGGFGSWSQAGHATAQDAYNAAQSQISNGAFGARNDLVIEVTDGNGNRVEV